MNVTAEIIKEYRVIVNGLDHSVKGRIIKTTSGDSDHVYLGELSHYCKPHETAHDVYMPTLLRSDIVQVEHLILSYLNKFTLIEVTPNLSY